MNSTLRTVFTATLWLAAGLACTHASAQRSTPVTVITTFDGDRPLGNVAGALWGIEPDSLLRGATDVVEKYGIDADG